MLRLVHASPGRSATCGSYAQVSNFLLIHFNFDCILSHKCATGIGLLSLSCMILIYTDPTGSHSSTFLKWIALSMLYTLITLDGRSLPQTDPFLKPNIVVIFSFIFASKQYHKFVIYLYCTTSPQM